MAKLEHITSQGTEETNAALAQVDLSNRERTRNIKDNQKAEKEYNRQHEAFRLQNAETGSPEAGGKTVSTGGGEAELDTFGPALPDKNRDLLKMLANRDKGENQ